MKKSLKIVISVIVIMAVLVSVALIYYFGAGYPYFHKVSTAECAIPGLRDGFTPQGLSYDTDSNSIIMCGYMKDSKQASRIYVLSGENYSQTKYVTLTVNEEIFRGHTGGITVYNTALFLASEGKVYRISKTDVLNAENKAQVAVIDNFETGNGADFVTVKYDNLWVGEFYKKGKYETAQSHHLITEDGQKNNALAFCYTLDLTKQYGVESTIPTKAMSLPALVQGMDFYEDGKIVLSTSYGLPDSQMQIYQDVLSQDSTLEYDYDGTHIPVYTLSKNKIVKQFKLPCMSEEIFVKDGKIWVLFESASQKYKLFTRTRMKNVYSLSVEF